MAEILNFANFLQKVDFWKTFSETDFSFWGYTFPFLSFIFLVFALPLALYSNIDQKSYWRKKEKKCLENRKLWKLQSATFTQNERMSTGAITATSKSMVRQFYDEVFSKPIDF